MGQIILNQYPSAERRRILRKSTTVGRGDSADTQSRLVPYQVGRGLHFLLSATKKATPAPSGRENTGNQMYCPLMKRQNNDAEGRTPSEQRQGRGGKRRPAPGLTAGPSQGEAVKNLGVASPDRCRLGRSAWHATPGAGFRVLGV